MKDTDETIDAQPLIALAREQSRVLAGNNANNDDEAEVQWYVEKCATHIFHPYGLYRIERWVKWAYEVWYVGWTAGKDPHWFTCDEQNFLAFARVAEVNLMSLDAIWDYVKWYLLITQMKNWDDFTLIETVDQLCFRDQVNMNMTPLDMWRKEDFLKHYQSRIVQPHIHRVHETVALDIFAVRNLNLEFHHLLVKCDGYLHHAIQILETELPLAPGENISSSLITGFSARES